MMPTKFLYLLVSGPEDVYLEQAYISASSCARHNPDASLTLLTDKLTAEGWLRESPLSGPFRALFKEIKVVDLDASLPAMQRSRLLKTGMREYVEGDFLFIDADTVVARSLADIDAFDAPLAACPDLHATFREHPHRRATVNMCKRLGFDATLTRNYFNSGVMLVRDTPENHAFFKAWQQNYLHGFAAGIKPDQPSLAQTDAQCAFPIRELPGEWNCQVQNGVRYLRDAYILHYMVTNQSSGQEDKLYVLNSKDLLLRVRKEGLAPVEDILGNPLRGYAPSVRVFAGEDLHFFQTRRYKWMRSKFSQEGFSLLEWLLKVKDHLLKRV
ncbi:MAG: hypothetical protein J6M31_09195 [Bacteroidales bacterium]|nr:hypothetical protein [Bacteroidales bacterium]